MGGDDESVFSGVFISLFDLGTNLLARKEQIIGWQEWTRNNRSYKCTVNRDVFTAFMAKPDG